MTNWKHCLKPDLKSLSICRCALSFLVTKLSIGQLDLDRQTEIHERDLDETQKARFRETQVFQDQEMRMAENVEVWLNCLALALICSSGFGTKAPRGSGCSTAAQRKMCPETG